MVKVASGSCRVPFFFFPVQLIQTWPLVLEEENKELVARLPSVKNCPTIITPLDPSNFCSILTAHEKIVFLLIYLKDEE